MEGASIPGGGDRKSPCRGRKARASPSGAERLVRQRLKAGGVLREVGCAEMAGFGLWGERVWPLERDNEICILERSAFQTHFCSFSFLRGKTESADDTIIFISNHYFSVCPCHSNSATI